MLTPRKILRLTAWPDPVLQERLEDAGFFRDPEYRAWIRYADPDETDALAQFLKQHHLPFRISLAQGRGQTTRLPKLSDRLLLKNGGSPSACALCGKLGVFCRQWIEGDDTDSIDYPHAARFFLCGQCVQDKMSPHPRLYAPADDQL